MKPNLLPPAHTRSVKHTRSLTFATCAIASTALGVAIACAPIAHETSHASKTPATPPATVTTQRAGVLGGHDRMALIALGGGITAPSVSATGAWQLEEQGGRALLVKGNGNEPWHLERKGALLRVAGAGGDATPWREGPFVARAEATNAFVQYAGKRYRGELWFTATDSGVLVVNRLPVEEYLRGVVPLELGTRAEIDRAALEAQAIAARSYAYIRVPDADGPKPRSGWHMTATVSYQVYGGVDAEAAVVNSAVDATSGLVIRYGGLLVDAPYFGSCGGHTASPTEVWRDARNEPYLPGVDDMNPATGKAYCDISPRATWTADFDESALADIVSRHLKAAGASNPTVGTITDLRVVSRSPSGRVGTLKLTTERGDITMSANEIRSVFHDVRGAILSSTYFSVDRESHERGRLTGVTLRGTGNGHGVGMCQWGAIGRARAGQDFRTILKAYYPGTVVGFVD